MGVNDVSVSVWQWVDGTTWAKVGEITDWTSLSVEPRHLQPGPWSISLPYNEQAAKVHRKNLLTFDFRGQRMTGVIEQLNPHSDDNGNAVIDLSGVDAMTLLGDASNWPLPTATLATQTVVNYTATSAPAETNLSQLIKDQYGRLYNSGMYQLAVAPSQGRGGSITLSERFSILLATVTDRCAAQNLGVRVGLVSTSGTRAELTVSFYQPQDRSIRVRLSHRLGTLKSWSQSDNVPTGTRAIVGGGGPGVERVFVPVTIDDVESDWGRRREVFVDARDTFDRTELTDRGTSDLADAAEQSSFDLEAEDAEGMRYGDHFSIGDLVTIELLTGVTKVDRLNVVTMTSDSSGLKVQLKPGNPDAANPLFTWAAIIRGLRKQVRDLQLED